MYIFRITRNTNNCAGKQHIFFMLMLAAHTVTPCFKELNHNKHGGTLQLTTALISIFFGRIYFLSSDSPLFSPNYVRRITHIGKVPIVSSCPQEVQLSILSFKTHFLFSLPGRGIKIERKAIGQTGCPLSWLS